MVRSCLFSRVFITQWWCLLPDSDAKFLMPWCKSPMFMCVGHTMTVLMPMQRCKDAYNHMWGDTMMVQLPSFWCQVAYIHVCWLHHDGSDAKMPNKSWSCIDMHSNIHKSSSMEWSTDARLRQRVTECCASMLNDCVGAGGPDQYFLNIHEASIRVRIKSLGSSI